MSVAVVARAYDLSDATYDGFVKRHVGLIAALGRAHRGGVQLLLLGDHTDHIAEPLRNLRVQHLPYTPHNATRLDRMRRAAKRASSVQPIGVEQVVQHVLESRCSVAVTIGPWLSWEYRTVWKAVPSVHLWEEDLLAMPDVAPQSPKARAFRRVERAALFGRPSWGPALVASISEAESRRARKILPFSKHLVLRYTDRAWSRCNQWIGGGGYILITGVYSQPRNADGLRKLLTTRRTAPGQWRHPVVVVSGTGFHPSLEPFARDDGVTFVKGAHDLGPYFENAAVAVVPGERSTGVKTAILDAWAAGCPVVALAASARGVMPYGARAMRIVEDQYGAIGTAAAVIGDSRAAHELSEEGRRVMRLYHDPGLVEQHFLDAVKRLSRANVSTGIAAIQQPCGPTAEGDDRAHVGRA